MNILTKKYLWLLLIAAAFFTMGFSLTGDPVWLAFFALIFILAVVFLMKYEIIGIYLMVFLFPFVYLELVSGDFNIPYVDVVGLALLIAWFIKALYLHITKKQKLSLKNFPGWQYMLIFVAACFLSLLNVQSEMFNFSLKYIFRPIIFFYLVYVVLPFNVIKNRKQLDIVFYIMFILGILVSIMGLWAVIFPPIEGLRRAIPISIFGVYPLGANHNLLAEVLVITIPIGLILFWLTKDILRKNIYLLGTIFMLGVALLTLSRAGWLAIFVEALIIVLLQYRDKIKTFFLSPVFYIVIIISLPILYLMYQLFNSTIVISSNLNRLKLIDVSLILFRENPLFGSGAGTYMQRLSEMKWYIIEYGGVLDAHGFLTKTLSELGLVGTLAFLGLIGYFLYFFIRSYLKSHGANAIIIFGLILAFIAQIAFQLFNTSYYLAKFWLPVGLALAAVKVLGGGKKSVG